MNISTVPMSQNILSNNRLQKFSVKIIIANFKFMCIHTLSFMEEMKICPCIRSSSELAEASPGELLNIQITGPHIHGVILWQEGGGQGQGGAGSMKFAFPIHPGAAGAWVTV